MASTPVALTPQDLHERRERVFLVLAGIFICSMTMLNILGLTRFIQLGPLALAVGVLPYPLTFLCTDIICEIYGKRRTQFLVTLGLGLNAFVMLFLYLGQLIPPVPPESMPPWQVLHLAQDLTMPNGEVISGSIELFQLIYTCTSGAVFASMLAYMAAQYCDLHLFHFWKRLTKGKHLWLRNNASTLTSQMVDSLVVISVAFGAMWWRGDLTTEQFLTLIGSSYLFKMVVALCDTGPFYLIIGWLRGYLQVGDQWDLATPAQKMPV
jgi:uncharacterized PurR-regulated membrane protein YhhQ (DUF165 family)